MNLIIKQSNLTMSTREIAALLSKQHSNIKVSAERLAEKGVIALQETHYQDQQNKQFYTEYLLTKRDSLVLVAQNCPEFTAAIVDRWQELETQYALRLPQTFAEALQLAADQAKQLELAAPKIAFVDNLVDRGNLMTSTQVAQKHKKSAVWLNKFLDEVGVYNKAVKRGRAFQQWFVDKELGEMKQTELGYSQVLFTNAGEVWINEKLISEGAI
jgi:phage regulator Rha-like protein